MKIIELKAQNVKRLQAVEIRPDGSLVTIGGRNGQGKSSCLDAIQYALDGNTSDRMPVRRGEDKAVIVVDLGDIVVRRTFTAAGGTSLVVSNSDGVAQTSPQTILDKLTGKLTFDPLDFARQKPKEQANTLRSLVGLDTTKMDEDRQRAYDERTAVNRDAKALESRLAGIVKHDVPNEPVSTVLILQAQSEAAKANSANQQIRRDAIERRQKVTLLQSDCKRVEVEIAKLEESIRVLRAGLETYLSALKTATSEAGELEKKASGLKDASLDGFAAQLKQAEEVNAKVRSNKQRSELVQQFKAKSSEAEAMTAKIEAIDTKKRRVVTEAKFPIEGLSFDASGGVTLNSIPFEQASSAEQLRVSVAIGLALNPKLRVLLVRDGSLLDQDSLALIAKMASDAEAQVWLERVGTDGQTSVVIEDGLSVPKEPVDQVT